MSPEPGIEDKSKEVHLDIDVEGIKRGQPIGFGALKSGGFIKQRQKDLFTVRLRCPGGRVPLNRLKKVVEVCEKYGVPYVHLSFRQSLELTYVHHKHFGAIKDELAKVGQEIATCGARVRVPTACSGCEYNPNGITDTQKMAEMVDKTFFARPEAHKFKISFSSCAIDCARTNEMDLGFQGAMKVKWEKEPCIGCRLCAKACLEGAIESDPKTGKPIYHPEKCLYCGDCVRSCPTDAWQPEKIGWMVRSAGKHGRHPVNGHKIAEFVPDEMVPKIIEAVLEWYEKNGKGRGRIRICTILQEKGKWSNFIVHLRPVLGEYAVSNPRPPEPNEIHF